jgi:hypothetical protein
MDKKKTGPIGAPWPIATDGKWNNEGEWTFPGTQCSSETSYPPTKLHGVTNSKTGSFEGTVVIVLDR